MIGLYYVPQLSTNASLNNIPTASEMQKAIKMMSSGKASSADAIPSCSWQINSLTLSAHVQ